MHARKAARVAFFKGGVSSPCAAKCRLRACCNERKKEGIQGILHSYEREAEGRDVVAGDLWAFDTMSPPQYRVAPRNYKTPD